MPLYTYRCPDHGDFALEMSIADHDYQGTTACCEDEDCYKIALQVFGVNYKRPMPGHYNHSLDRYISNESQTVSELHRQSDEMSVRMGFDVNYELVDPTDAKAVGVTDAGLEETARRKHDTGEAPLATKSFS